MLVIPIEYGTASICSGKRGDKYFYKWIVYLKHAQNLDLSHIIESVSFVLHESFENSLREAKTCPYAVLEEGWGEFDVVIRIKLLPPFQESILEFTHFLKFYSTKSSKKPYIFKSYDEIVLQNVPQQILDRHNMILQNNQKFLFPEENKDDEYLKLQKTVNQDDQMDLTKHDDFYNNAIEFIDEEIQKLRQETVNLDNKIKSSYEYLASQNNQLQMEKFRKFADTKTGEHPFLNINIKQNIALKFAGLMILPFRIIFILHLAFLHKMFQIVFGQSRIFFKLESFLCNLMLIIFGVSYSLNENNKKNNEKKIYLCNYSSFIDVFLAKKIFQTQICKKVSSQQTIRFFSINTFKNLLSYAFYPQQASHLQKTNDNGLNEINPQNQFIHFFEGLRTNNKFYAEMNNLEAFKIFNYAKENNYSLCLVKFVHHNKSFCNSQNQGFFKGVLKYLTLLGNHVYIQTEQIDKEQLKVPDTMKLSQKKLYQQDPILYCLGTNNQKYEEFLEYYKNN